MDLAHYASRSRVDALTQRLNALGIRFANSAEAKARDLIQQELASIPLLGLHEQTIPYGPEVHYVGWSEPRQPVCKRAELWLCLADGEEKLICNTDDQPHSLVYALAATAATGEIYELVDTGTATHGGAFGGRKLKDKVALASHHAPLAAQLETLVDRKAAGLLLGPKEDSPSRLRADEQLPTQTLLPTRPFLFHLDDRSFEYLRGLLAREVPLKVRVVIELEEAAEELAILGADLAGASMNERIVLISETNSPWLPRLVEVARILGHATLEGTLKPAAQKISFIFAANAHAALGWLEEKCPPCRSVLYFVEQPTMRHGASDTIHSLIWRRRGEGGLWGSTPCNTSKANRSVTQISMHAGPASPAKALGRDALATLATTILEWANLSEADFPRLLNEIHLELLNTHGQNYAALRRRFGAAENKQTEAKHLLWRSERSLAHQRTRTERLANECQALVRASAESALRISELVADLDRCAKALHRSFAAELVGHSETNERLSAKRRALTAVDRRASALVVQLHLDGLTDAKRLLADLPFADARWLTLHLPQLSDQPLGQFLDRFDGQRSLFDVFEELELDYPQSDLRLLWRYLEMLQTADRVRLEQRSTISPAADTKPSKRR